MKKLRAITIFIFLFGVLFFVWGLLLLSALERGLLTSGLEDRAAMVHTSVSAVYSEFFYSSIAYASIGLASMVSAAGLFWLKEWGRRLWLGLLIFMAVGTVYWLVFEYSNGLLWRTENAIGYPVIALFVGGMWVYFTRDKTKDRFRRA